MSQVALQAGGYPGFRGMKRLGVIVLPDELNGMLAHHRVTPNILNFASTHLNT